MRTFKTAAVTLAGAVALAALGGAGGRAEQALPGGPPGGAGLPGQAERAIVAQFDKDGDGRLNAVERKAARGSLAAEPQRGRGGRGGPGAGSNPEPVSVGPPVDRASVKPVPATVPFYDPDTVRTLFFDFENSDWESELMAFKNTDVEVPVTLTVDGRSYRDVGVKFRGASSFSMVPEGRKHSMNVSLDFVRENQQLLAYSSLNLLNGHADPSFLRAVLYLQAARDYLPAAKANFVRVVINGESWGVYSNVQQVNRTLLQEWYKTDAGARWKVPGSPNGRGGLEYMGDDVNLYKRVFEIKTNDDPKAWAALVNLTKVLNQTPLDTLEAALAPMLDIDGTLRFLAVESVFVNNDGYWTRASDYNLYLGPDGRFHLLPHDVNETFASPGPGGRGRGGDASLDPLSGLGDATKPLRSRLLAVPALRARYLAYTRDIATKWLDWNTLGPLANKFQRLIAADVKADTHRLDSYADFEAGPATLKAFADTRRAFVLRYSPP